MKTKVEINLEISILEHLLKENEKIQHTHQIPFLRGKLEALRWVMVTRRKTYIRTPEDR